MSSPSVYVRMAALRLALSSRTRARLASVQSSGRPSVRKMSALELGHASTSLLLALSTSKALSKAAA